MPLLSELLSLSHLLKLLKMYTSQLSSCTEMSSFSNPIISQYTTCACVYKIMTLLHRLHTVQVHMSTCLCMYFSCRGMSPASAELMYIKLAQQLPEYGHEGFQKLVSGYQNINQITVTEVQ